MIVGAVITYLPVFLTFVGTTVCVCVCVCVWVNLYVTLISMH
jgi:hypothetical protein